jgi:Domain of unknown function (DUF4340)
VDVGFGADQEDFTMTSRRLLAFVVLALVAMTAAVLLANQRTQTSQSANDLLYPDLKSQADDVKAIRIFKAGDVRALEIVRSGDEWTLTERDGYPIAVAKARNLVRALTNAKVLEEKTSDPTKYSALSVEDVKGADAKGVRIELEGPTTPINLIVGKEGPGGKSSYVRRVGEEKSWLVSEQLSASPEAGDWLDKEIINVSADRVQSATVSVSGQKPYTASKSSRMEENFKVEPLSKGKELGGASAANSVASALMGLSLDDVQPKAKIATDKPSAQATFKTFDGLVVELEGYKHDDKHFLTLTTHYDAALADQFRVKTADAEKTSEEPSNATQPSEKVAEEAKSRAAKAGAWAYEIPQYKYDSIFRPLDELLKK